MKKHLVENVYYFFALLWHHHRRHHLCTLQEQRTEVANSSLLRLKIDVRDGFSKCAVVVVVAKTVGGNRGCSSPSRTHRRMESGGGGNLCMHLYIYLGRRERERERERRTLEPSSSCHLQFHPVSKTHSIRTKTRLAQQPQCSESLSLSPYWQATRQEIGFSNQTSNLRRGRKIYLRLF